MSSSDTVASITVPGQRTDLAPPSPDRVRALRRHLIEAIRDMRSARRPDRLIQRRSAEPTGFAADVVRASCAHCQGSCCMSGGTHAFIDERTMARVRAEQPELDARAVIRAYVERVAPLGVRGSCLFHGEAGCTLSRSMRAELCNSYFCNGLRDFLKLDTDRVDTVVITTHAGEERLITQVR